MFGYLCIIYIGETGEGGRQEAIVTEVVSVTVWLLQISGNTFDVNYTRSTGSL